MALTETAHRRDDRPTGAAPARTFLSRLSIGHVVMVLAGLVAILLNLAFLRSSTDTIEVVVAGSSLPAGTVVTDATVDLAEVGDAGALVNGLITSDQAASLVGSTLTRTVEAGEPIRRSDLRPDGTVSGLREYSLELDAAQAAAGRITAMDVVDVIATIDGHSFYVASTVDVISVTVDDSTLGVGDDLILVLAVDDRTALEIASAESIGSIAVVRSTGAEPPATGPVTVRPSP